MTILRVGNTIIYTIFILNFPPQSREKLSSPHPLPSGERGREFKWQLSKKIISQGLY